MIVVEGAPDLAASAAAGLLAQLVGRQSPEEMLVAAALAAASVRPFGWLRWLPHVESVDDLAARPAAVTALVDRLLGLPPGFDGPRVVVAVDGAAGVDADVLERLMSRTASTGIRVVWFGADPPERFSTRIDAASAIGEIPRPAAFERLGRALASVGPATSLPVEVGLADVLGGTPAPADIASAWSVSEGGSLDAPVGMGADGPVTLDLCRDGPHALISGQLGSERTSLLVSWLVALASRHPPERLAFVGVAVPDAIARLPHAAGPAHVDALLAESARRSDQLTESRTSDLSRLAALDPARCPPRLVIVVDGWCTELDALTDVAEAGVDLGVHLVMTGEPFLRAPDESVVITAAGRPDRWEVGDRVFVAAGPDHPRRPGAGGRVRVERLGFGRPPSAVAPDGPVQLDDVIGAIGLAFERSGRRRPTQPGRPD